MRAPDSLAPSRQHGAAVQTPDAAPASPSTGRPTEPVPGRTPRARGRTAALERALLLVSVVLPAALLGLAAWQSYREVLATGENQIERTLRILQEHAVKVFETHRLAIDQVAGRIRFIDWGQEADRADLHGLLKQLGETLDQVATITVTDPEGRLRASGRSHPVDPGVSFTDRDWYEALKPGPLRRPYVSRTYIGRQSGQAVFNVAGRINNPDGSFGGAIAVSVDRGYFESFYSRVGREENQSVLLVRADGTILARSPPTELMALPPDAPFFPWLQGDERRLLTVASPFDGVERTFGFRKVGEYPVYVGYGVTRSAALAPWRQNLAVYGIVAALASLALLAVSGLAIRQSRREGAAVASLERARTELAEANAQLESTVAERTAELRESNEEMQRYAYIVSHDLRAPLVNIMGFTQELVSLQPELLEAGTLPADAPRRTQAVGDFDEAIGFITAAINKMEGLIGAILKLSREGRRSLVAEHLEMTALIQELADAQRHQAETVGATVSVGPLPNLHADRVGIEQVFGNLIDNAVKYLDGGRPGRITVSGEVVGRLVRYRVEDNGRGIGAADHGRVFELFRRSGVQNRPGEGIGLAHVRTLVRAMGGRIDLSSELGRGTVFTVTFPAEMRAASSAR